MLGKKWWAEEKPEQKEWLSAETNQKIQERKTKKAARGAKKEAQKKYAKMNSEVRRNIRTDKRNFG